jgi:hypothetical protein
MKLPHRKLNFNFIRDIAPVAGISREPNARTAASVPMLPLAPGRFSMTKGWPSRSESH